MPVKPVISADEFAALAPPERFAYVEREGNYEIDLTGPPRGYVPVADHDEASAKLAEFRDNNRSLHAKLEAAEAKLAALSATAATGDAHAQKLAEVQAALERSRQAHRAVQLKAAVVAAFGAVGGELKAADFVTGLAGEVFEVTEAGKLTTRARDADGSPLSLEGWLQTQASERPFLFRASRGGGAATSGTGSHATGRPTVDASDALDFGRHIEGIAKGDVQVR